MGVQVTTEMGSYFDTDEHPFGNCFVRLRLNIRKGKSSSNSVLAVQIGTPAECDTFVACIRACAKHQRAALMVSRQEQPFDEASGLSVPSTVLRAVGSMATYLRDGGRADTEWKRTYLLTSRCDVEATLL